VRQAAGASTHTLADAGFLIGTVAGCDLRLPGALPPVLCLISRRPTEVSFRKLAPTQAILLNGRSSSSGALSDGDRLTVGKVELVVHVSMPEPAANPAGPPTPVSDPETFFEDLRARNREVDERTAQLAKREAELTERENRLEEDAKTLQADRVVWYQRRQEMEKELAGKSKPSAPPPQVRASEQEKALAAGEAELQRQKQELAGVRQELADIRRQLYDRYKERRDRLSGVQEAIDRAAANVQERKRQVDVEFAKLAAQAELLKPRQTELEARAAQLADQDARLETERLQLEAGRAELANKTAELHAREQALADARADLEKSRQGHRNDLIRLDRLQGDLDERERQLQEKSTALDQRAQQLDRDGQELEEQVEQAENLRAQLAAESDRLAKQKAEQESAFTQLGQRAAALEGQQTTMAALRTRLERMREEVRREEQHLADERARHESIEAELQQQLKQSLQARADLDGEQKLREQERQQLVERSAVLKAAVTQLRKAEEDIAKSEDDLRQQSLELERRWAEVNQAAASIQERVAQTDQAQEQLQADRQALRERTQALSQTEEARAKLQDQLRRRAEELAGRQRTLDEQNQRLEEEGAALHARRGELEQLQQQARQESSAQQAQITAQQAELEDRFAALGQAEESLKEQQTRLEQMRLGVEAEQKALTAAQAEARALEQEREQAQARRRDELADLQRLARELLQQVPDAELRASTALESLTHARDQLREHLGEVHAYVRKCQDDLQVLGAQARDDAARLGEREQVLRRHQEEHHLAVAEFRQQLIDWQGQVADKKRHLAQDETRLERRQAEVAEQAKEIDATTERLARQAVDLEQQARAVAGRRQEVDRHLADMQAWYRHKLRELAGIDEQVSSESVPPAPVNESDDEDAIAPGSRNILSLTGPVEGADRQLGELLRSLDLIDGDTLTALLVEARRQRRSLRQVLLAGGVVTLYQMALIEAGNVQALMLGPVRVVDRLRVTARETVYRVFDPRSGQEAVLRHLAEAEMSDPTHPADFRQRFTQAQLNHPHWVRTLEVLDIAGRPAVLQEWLTGLSGSDWPPLASVPGVCFRILNQAALGLAQMHNAGLVHGHLQENLLLLTADGTLKIGGLGEPPWLALPPYPEDATAADDLAALGRLAAGWCTSGVRRGSKTKALPRSFIDVLERLGSAGFPSAAALLDDLDRIGAEIPANAEAWDRLLKYVKDHATPAAALRQSA
jgi:chromosome segregation ATPase